MPYIQAVYPRRRRESVLLRYAAISTWEYLGRSITSTTDRTFVGEHKSSAYRFGTTRDDCLRRMWISSDSIAVEGSLSLVISSCEYCARSCDIREVRPVDKTMGKVGPGSSHSFIVCGATNTQASSVMRA